jgi:hypothetical protein
MLPYQSVSWCCTQVLQLGLCWQPPLPSPDPAAAPQGHRHRMGQQPCICPASSRWMMSVEPASQAARKHGWWRAQQAMQSTPAMLISCLVATGHQFSHQEDFPTTAAVTNVAVTPPCLPCRLQQRHVSSATGCLLVLVICHSTVSAAATC